LSQEDRPRPAAGGGCEMSIRQWWWTAATVTVAALAMAAVSRAAGDAVPPADQQRLAGGEVRYGGQWSTVQDIFEQYGALRKEIEGSRAKDKAAALRITDINKAVAGIQDERHKQQDAIEIDLGKSQTKQQKAQALLAMPAPNKPRAEEAPPEPNRGDFKDNLSYSTAHSNWLRDKERIQNDNQRRQAIYESELDRYQDMQQRGKAAFDESGAAINECTRRIEDAYYIRKGREKGLLAERAKLTEEQDARAQAIAEPVAKTAGMVDALRTSPEPIRLAAGVLQWHEQFYATDELQKKVDKLTAEITDARKQAEERAAKAGAPLAKEWRHPKQDDVDELQTLIEKAKSAAPAKAP